jgi:hypothetical protein
MAMPKIEFRLQMFRGDWDQIWSQMRLLWLMEGLVRVNQTHLRQFDAFKERGLVQNTYPSVYRSGLHYETEKGTEIWPDIPSLLSNTMGEGLYPGAWGDCEDLSCYRTAELRELPYHFARPMPGQKGKVEVADPRFPPPDVHAAVSGADKPTVVTPGKAGGPPEIAVWPGWKRYKGGIWAKPFAKWRRGPTGSYHYHALTLLPDGRLEDPSLVLGMGKEREFASEDMAKKMMGGAPVVIQFAKPPDVMVVDPEKPSGYAGGKATAMDKRVTDLLKQGLAPEDVAATLGDAEMGAYLTNTIQLCEGEFDVDAVIGWNRAEGRFEAKDEESEERRLLGYANH